MKSTSVARAVVYLALAASSLAGLGAFAMRRAPASESRPDALRGPAALEALKQKGEYDSLQAALQEAQRGVSRREQTPLGRAAWHAPNRAAGYDAYITETGVSLVLGEGTILGLALSAYGYGESLVPVGPGEARGEALSVTVARSPELREWYVNGPDGLEHGFTISAPPGPRHPGLPLQFVLQPGEGWRATADEAAGSVSLQGPSGEAVEYGKLAAHDSAGLPLPARMKVDAGRIVIEVKDDSAEYPLTIDPLFTLQQRALADDAGAADRMGWSVALSGDTAILGAPYDDVRGVDQGSAYVFVRSGSAWVQQARLLANDGAASDFFGHAVALEGDTALVSALYAPGPASDDQGGVYVFTRTGTTWTQRQRLNAHDGASGELFGGSIALDGDTAIVGARVHRVGATIGQGAAYVFVRHAGAWALQKELIADDGTELDQFGAAVAIDGDTALVGAPYDDISVRPDQGSAYVFTRSGTTWTQLPKLTDFNGDDRDQFGRAVAVSGDKIVIGVPLRGNDDSGTVLAFKNGARGWEQINGFEPYLSTANAHFGTSVALDGDRAIAGATLGLFEPGPDRRAAYAAYFDGDWNQIWQLGSPVGSASDRFGYAVSLDGNRALVGAFQADATAVDQGAGYLFELRAARHNEEQKLTAFDGAERDHFGRAVALSGDTLVIGAPEDDLNVAQDQGSAYLFTRSEGRWIFRFKIVAADGDANDHFGSSLAVSGDTLAIGAPGADNGTAFGMGAVYVYARNGTAWPLQQTIRPHDGKPYDGFGEAVALDGTTLAVGASLADIDKVTDQGSVYVYTRAGTTWSFQQKLLGLAGSLRDRFGNAVALSGDTLAVGAFWEEDTASQDMGGAYVFVRGGPTWRLQAHLVPGNGHARAYFGSAVAISEETLVVGAPEFGTRETARLGAAYVYTRRGTTWVFQTQLGPESGSMGALFGAALAFRGDRLVVGMPAGSPDAKSQPGLAYVFIGKDTNWTQQQILGPSDNRLNKVFGGSVAIDGETVAVGAYGDVVGTSYVQGSTYLFASPVCQDVTVAPDAMPNAALGAPYRHPITPSRANGVGAYRILLTAGALPPGLTLEADGRVTGTPTATGVFRFTVTATHADSLCAGRREYALTVTPPCPSLTLSPATLADGKRGKAFQQSLASAGGKAPYTYAVTAGAPAPGLRLSAGGVLSGTPTTAGAFPITVVTTDANGCTATRVYSQTIHPDIVGVVSAASYQPIVAPESIAAAFGFELALQTASAATLPLPVELAGVRVRVRDSLGAERAAPLFFVSPGQINFQVPPMTEPGMATISVTGPSGGATGEFEVWRTAPGLFTANADGQGPPHAMVLRVRANGTRSFEPAARFDGTRYVPAPIDLGAADERVYLVAYGTGFRYPKQFVAHFGLELATVLFAGAVPDFIGLDQLNILIPRTLIGVGEVPLRFAVDGAYANTVRVHIR